MKKLIALLVIGFILFYPAVNQAVQVTIDLEKLDKETASDVLEAKKRSDEQVSKTPTVDEMGKWANVGEQIGKAIAATCKELSIEVNKFVDTPVGKLTVVLIIWKIVGKDLLGIVGGTLVWVVVTSLLLWSLRLFHMREKVVDEETKRITYIPRYEFATNDARAVSACVHVAIFLGITITCLAIVFS